MARRRRPAADPNATDAMRLAMATVVLEDAAILLSKQYGNDKVYGKPFSPRRCYELILTSAALVLDQRNSSKVVKGPKR